LNLPSARGRIALLAIALVAVLQPFSLVADASTARRATRLQPKSPSPTVAASSQEQASAPLDAPRAEALRVLLDEALAGAPFALEEIELLNRFAFDGTISELEADVVISRALYARYVATHTLTNEQEMLLDAYTRAVERRARGILDAKRERLEREEAEWAKAPRAPEVAPSNDTCSGALIIPTGPLPQCSAVVADITDATTTGDPGVPSCQSDVSRSVWFRFVPQASGSYRFTTCAGDGTMTTVDDTVMAIYTSTNGCNGPFTEIPVGALTDGCDDDSCSAEDDQSVITTQLVGGTTYYIVVWKFGASAPTAGNTAVQVCVNTATAPMTPANDTCSGATPLTLNIPATGSSANGTNDYQLAAMSPCFPTGQTATTAAGRDVVYSFTAPSAGSYSFRIQNFTASAAGGSSSDLVLYLASSCPAATPGTPVTVNCTVASNASSSTVSGLEELTCVPLAMNQQVFLFVDEAALGSGASFSVLAEACNAAETEPNNTPATADAFACGIVGGVNPGSDADFYAIGTPATGSRIFAAVDASTATPSADLDLRVNTSTDTLEYDDSNDDALLGAASANVAGTIANGSPLFLQVDRNGSPAPTSTGSPYRLYAVVQPPIAMATAETEPNNTTATADAAENNYFAGTLATPSPSTDVDLYRFTATAGDLVFIGLDGDPLRNLTPFDGKLELLDASGAVLVTVNDGAFSSSSASGAGTLFAIAPFSPGEALVTRATASGTYYVRVSAGSTSTTTAAGDYLLSISLDCQAGGGGAPTLGTDTVGIYAISTGAFFLRNTNSSGAADTVFSFGPATAGLIALSGDWDGDGDDTIGIYDQPTGTFFLRNSNSPGPADLTFTFGAGGNAIFPVTGDWNGDGVDTIGIYNQATGAFFLRNSNSSGGADLTFTFGAGNDVPISGDWDGDGDDTVGIYNVAAGAFFLRNTNSNGGADIVLTFGPGGVGVVPVTGDYDGDGDDTIGIYNQATGTFFLRNTNTTGGADLAFSYGPTTGVQPLIGDWDGF
jgi:hypothetical protein